MVLPQAGNLLHTEMGMVYLDSTSPVLFLYSTGPLQPFPTMDFAVVLLLSWSDDRAYSALRYPSRAFDNVVCRASCHEIRYSDHGQYYHGDIKIVP